MPHRNGLMKKERVSAGLLMFREGPRGLEVFLAHPGGPFFSSRDDGVWSIPKGTPERGESLLATAEREFFEEVGLTARPPYFDLGSITQKGGKVVFAGAFQGGWIE